MHRLQIAFDCRFEDVPIRSDVLPMGRPDLYSGTSELLACHLKVCASLAIANVGNAADMM